MRIIMRQRLLSILDHYEIFDEVGQLLFKVNGKVAIAPELRIQNAEGEELGYTKFEMFHLLPHYNFFAGGEKIDRMAKKVTLFRARYELEASGWTVQGNFMDHEYQVTDAEGREIANISKAYLKVRDTYAIDVPDERNVLRVLMIALIVDSVQHPEH